jgi:hypothetical protein
MANTKISQLPIWTGTAADLRWFVMNNSGETETFKYSGYTSPYRWNSSTSAVTEVNITKSTQFNTRGGTNTETANSYSNFVVGTGNTIGNASTQHVIFGEGNTATGSAGSSVGSFMWGVNNTSTSNSRWSAALGYGLTIGDRSFAIGENNSCTGIASFVGGNNSNVSSAYSFAFGSGNNVTAELNWSIGYDNDITGGFAGILLGGQTNRITAGNYNSILGGRSSTITGGNNVAMIGTSGRTASADYTTYVENLHTYRTPSTQVQPISSGTTFTCNLENGAKSQFYITGTSTINITNVRDGASFMIKTQTDGNYNMTWTATGGYTFVFEGGIKDPGNSVTDIFVFEVFGSVIYGNRRHNYS